MTLTKTPIPFCSLKFIDELPRMREVDDRLKETLREIRNRKLMASGRLKCCIDRLRPPRIVAAANGAKGGRSLSLRSRDYLAK